MAESESERIREAYEKRRSKGWGKRYSWYQRGTLLALQERERVLLSILQDTLCDLSDKRILDIGCGSGNTLIPFLFYGAKSENCFGVDILGDSIEVAKERLPGMTFAHCSAENIPFEKGIFDLVTMFTCLSSVLDNDIRRRICQQAFAMVRPSGWVLIYDFKVNNPFNPDVKAVRLGELKEYFLGCKCYSKKLTLLPPVGRMIGPYSMTIYNLLSVFPFLRTHRMTIFQKPASQSGA